MTRQLISMATGLFGLTMLICAPPFCRALQEPFVTWYYPIAWYGLILFMDAVRSICGKGSLIFDHPFRFAALIFWSAVLWFLFEAFNFRLANWYYVFVTRDPVVRLIGSWLSFGTVLPALFLIEKLLEDLGVFASRPAFRLRIGRRGMALAVAGGALGLALPMIWPRHAFPLIWVFGFLLPLPLFARSLEGTWLTELAEGRAGRLARILLAGLICGVIWEFLNSFARIRWIYTVPFLEDLKFFEMPPLGYLGFPPFALECVVLYGVLSAFGLAPEAENAGRVAERTARSPLRALFAALGGLCLGIATLQGMALYTFDSCWPRPVDLDLPVEVKTVVGDKVFADCFLLDARLANPGTWDLLRLAGVEPRAVSDQVDLALLRGMGCEQARRLVLVGVDSIEKLAGQDAGDLAERLEGSRDSRAWSVRRSRALVWIKAARRQ
jgi:hypothetical protein